MKTVFISGASSGFGHAIAEQLSRHNYTLILSGRNEKKLSELTRSIQNTSASKVFPLLFDIRDYNACKKAITSLPEFCQNIDILINNAGMTLGLNPLHEGNIEDWEQTIDTNIKGVLYLTRLIAPQMVKKQEGHIINMGSVTSHEVYYGGNVYCASKHALLALTKAMRTDFLSHNIKVTQISPGAAKTNFAYVRYKGDTQKAQKVYEGYTPLLAKDIAEIVDFALHRPAHVCLNEIIVTPTEQFNGIIHRKQT